MDGTLYVVAWAVLMLCANDAWKDDARGLGLALLGASLIYAVLAVVTGLQGIASHFA